METSNEMGSGIAATDVEVGRFGKPGVLKLAIALASGATMLLAASYAGAEPLEGTWRVTRHGVNCVTGQQVNSFQAIMQFGKGDAVTGFAVPPGSTPANTSPEYGVWKHEPGPHHYSFKLLSNGYDDNGVFEGATEVSGNLQLQKGDDTFSYTAVISFFDANGGLLFSRCGAATGARFE